MIKLKEENLPDGQRTNNNIEGTNSTTNSSNQISRGEIRTGRQDSRTISSNDTQRSNGTGLFIRRNGVWVIDKNSKNPFNTKNTSKTGYKELPQDIESGNSFCNAITQAKADLGGLGASVHAYTPEEYSQMKMFLSEDGLSGMAIKPDGDIVSVFVNPKANFGTTLKRGHALVEFAKEQGGAKLDAFDTYLPDFYKKHGFEETGRNVWNEQYKPEGWSKDFYKQYNNGEPDVVYMELKTKPETEIPEKVNKPEQLKLDLDYSSTPPKEAIESVVNGLIAGVGDIADIVDNIIKEDKTLSSFKWKDIANNADLKEQLVEMLGNKDTPKELLRILCYCIS